METNLQVAGIDSDHAAANRETSRRSAWGNLAAHPLPRGWLGTGERPRTRGRDSASRCCLPVPGQPQLACWLADRSPETGYSEGGVGMVNADQDVPGDSGDAGKALTDSSLLRRLRQGNQDAATQLYL